MTVILAVVNQLNIRGCNFVNEYNYCCHHKKYKHIFSIHTLYNYDVQHATRDNYLENKGKQIY